MELNIQYLNNKNGEIQAVQIPIKDWERLQSKLILLSKELSLKEDLTKAFKEVHLMQTGKVKNQSLSEFLNEIRQPKG